MAFGTAVATTQGLYHMLARTKAQSGGALVKEEITPTPGSVYFTSKSTASFPKGLDKHFSRVGAQSDAGKGAQVRKKRACSGQASV